MHDLFESWERAGAGDLSTFTTNWLRTAGPDTIVLDRAAGVVRRTPPAEHPADRPHTLRVGGRGVDGAWTDRVARARRPGDAVRRAGGAPVVLDPYDDTWALVQPDPPTVGRARGSCCRRSRTRCCAPASGTTCAARFHNAAVAPADVLDLAVASLPVEDTEDTGAARCPGCSARWCRWPPRTRPRRVHDAALAKLGRPPRRVGAPARGVPDGDLHRHGPGPAARLARGATCRTGIDLDVDLRWRVLVRLATLGAVDLAELDAELAVEPTGASASSTPRARASLPTPRPRRGRGPCFTGEIDVPNYELEAAGIGLWRGGQERAHRPYVDRYFADLPETVEVRSGWVLGRRRGVLLPADLADRGDPGRGPGAGRRRRRWTCRCAAGWSTRPTTSAPARRAAGLPAP